MKIFILDDMQERHDACRKKFPDAEIISTYDAKGAIAILSANLSYDLIALDHDLGGKIFISTSEENSGSTVAKFLADKDIKCKIIIHSLNYWGAKNMMSYLPKAEYIPFYLNL